MPSPGGHDYVARLLVVSTPDGLTSRWEDGDPSDEVRSEVAALARRLGEDGLGSMERLEPSEEIRRLLDERRFDEVPLDELFSAEPAEHVAPPGADASVFLRLNVRTCDAREAERLGQVRAIDFEFGPMGAPPEYPRVPVDMLLRHAASTA
jgi:hypothetical protein